MTLSIQTVTFLLGCGLLIIAILGGGLEIKEVKIPTLPSLPRAMSGLFGALLVALALIKPALLPGADAPKSLDKPGSEASTVGAFDGRWDGTGAGWHINGTITKGEFVGNVESCVRRDGTHAANIATIHGRVYANGDIVAETLPSSRPNEVRDISGRIPNVQIQARFPKEVGCDDANIKLERVAG
jgi:hypothetical protein